MSLDVSLTGETRTVKCYCPTCDHKHERQETKVYFDANITHNLGEMAREAGIYQFVWRPEELGITKAKELIEPLQEGLALMRADPKRFEKFNSPNGWGLYKYFVPWLERYLYACREFPEANIEVSR